MRNHWEPKKLNELGYVGRGKSRHRPRNDPKLYGGIYPLIQTANIMASELYITKYSQTYNEVGLKQSKLWDKDTLCMTIAGENTAETALLSFKACFPDSIVGFIAYSNKADVRFIKYYLDTVKQQFKNISRGATQDNLSLDKLLSFDIFTPPLPTQHKIASILSVYDDLIENNTRRIAILEEMAQTIYQEWFVHFCYPGHEKNKMVESELGMIPEGWKKKPVEELLDYHIGGGWGQDSQNDQFNNAAYVIRGTDIPDAHHVSVNNCPMRYHKTSNLISRRLQFEDIVFEVSGGSKGQPVGRALFISQQILNAFNKDVICASFCKLLRAKKNILHPYLFYLHLLNIYTNGKIDQYQVQSTGITNFKFEQFLNNEILVIPPTALQENFYELALPMINLTQVLGARNANLRRTRDLLLPKLISGEIDVETLDIDIPDIPEPKVQQNTAPLVQPEPIDASQLALLF